MSQALNVGVVRRFGGLLIILIAMVVGGCGSAPVVVVPAATSAPEATSEPVATAEPTARSSAVQGVQEVQKAVVQIEAEGTFVDPTEGTIFNAAGRGSGFIIDESGIIVTNNHVVSGAALVKVLVNGETKPRNAKILGVSECADLAVIDIEGDGFPFLDWYEDDIKVGTDVFAAGYPLGDPEFTLTRGIVSKARANGESTWASLDSVIEHDSTINQGNSGGPLVTQDGQVIGVNYAGESATGQYFAISREDALRVIEQLKDGNDVESIGVNGTAFALEDGSSGIWVASVASGSPADKAGVKPGDIIHKLERLVLAVDGTMADYCDILRTHSPDDTLTIEVVRPETSQVLEGQLNGRELEEITSFAQQEEQIVEDQGDTTTTYSDYQTISDETGVLQVSVPVEWSDTNGARWVQNEEELGISISAAPDLQQFQEAWNTPGMFLGASRSLAQTSTVADLLDSISFQDSCTYDGRQDYSDSLYTGQYDVWTACGGSDAALLVVAFTPEDNSFLGLVQVQVVTSADLDAVDQILSSFVVNGDF